MTLDKIKAAKRIFACGGGGMVEIYNLVHILFILERCPTHCFAAHKEIYVLFANYF